MMKNVNALNEQTSYISSTSSTSDPISATIYVARGSTPILTHCTISVRCAHRRILRRQ
jgi:hypothetical protein